MQAVRGRPVCSSAGRAVSAGFQGPCHLGPYSVSVLVSFGAQAYTLSCVGTIWLRRVCAGLSTPRPSLCVSPYG